jgi:hypothetical protein
MVITNVFICSTDKNNFIHKRSCRFEVGDCVQKAVEYFDQWMVETEPDHVNP